MNPPQVYMCLVLFLMEYKLMAKSSLYWFPLTYQEENLKTIIQNIAFSDGSDSKEPACQYRRCKRCTFNPWVGKIPWRRARQPTTVFLPGESHELRSLVGYSP